MLNKNHIKLLLLELIRPAIAVTAATIIVSFASGQIMRISESIGEKRTIYATLERRTETISKIEKDLAFIGDEAINKIKAAFPPSDDIIDFILATESLASRTTVKQTMNFGALAPFLKKGQGEHELEISAINFTANLSGNGASLVEYLKGLETLPYLTSLSSLQISSNNKTTNWETEATVFSRGALYTKESK